MKGDVLLLYMCALWVKHGLDSGGDSVTYYIGMYKYSWSQSAFEFQALY